MRTFGVIIIAAVLIGVARFFITPHPLSLVGSYQALAHLFVGGLLGAWAMGRFGKGEDFLYIRGYGWVALGLSLLETAVAIGSRMLQ